MLKPTQQGGVLSLVGDTNTSTGNWFVTCHTTGKSDLIKNWTTDKDIYFLKHGIWMDNKDLRKW